MWSVLSDLTNVMTAELQPNRLKSQLGDQPAFNSTVPVPFRLFRDLCVRTQFRRRPTNRTVILTRRGDLEHFPIRLAIPRVCKESFAFFFGNLSEKRSDRFPKRLNSTRLHFCVEML